MPCDYRPQIVFQYFNVLVPVNSTIHSCYSSHTMPGYTPPNHYTDLTLGRGTHAVRGFSFILAAPLKILCFAPKTTWLSSEKITLSQWPLTFHLVLPLHQFSLFLRFTSCTLTFFLTTRLWYPCRYKHRCAVRWETRADLCWLNLLVKSPRGSSFAITSCLSQPHKRSFVPGIQNSWSSALRFVFCAPPLLEPYTITSETVNPRQMY
jgi:hypothetical protein